MHQQDFSGDSFAARKTSFQSRRGSNTTSGGGASGSAAGSSNALSTHDYQSPPQARSSSPGPHHQPQSLNISQSQTSSAQVKKKSGFQITSVTPAQISASTNNSIADDTESYDDMDESHTEDLSEMLDASVSRATDNGVPERSSSDETLNSLHGVETPGVASPNEPLPPQSLPQVTLGEALQPQVPLAPGNMMNGTVHTLQEKVGPASGAGMFSGVSGTNITKMAQGKLESIPDQSSATVIVGRDMDVSSVCGGSGFPPSVGTKSIDSSGCQQRTSSLAGSFPGGTGTPNNTQVGVAVAVTLPTTPSTQTQHAQAAPGSRFRVVKLDSNSEPFRKGRWTCTEYYEKEVPAAAPTSDPAPVPSAACPEGEAGSAVPSVVQYGGTEVEAVTAQSLQPYQPPQQQDYTSSQAAQNPLHSNLAPQDPNPMSMTPPVTVAGAPHGLAHSAGSQAIPQQVPCSLDHIQTSYPTLQFPAGLLNQASSRPPDFIQPTAPLQSQVLPPGTLGMSIPGPAAVSQPHQLHHLPGQHPHPLNPSTPFVTTLRADLQPLLTHNVPLGHTSLAHSGTPYGGSIPTLTASQLEDAQRLLFQHQGLLGLTRVGVSGGNSAERTLGIAKDASALVVAAAGLKTHSGDGEEDSSSGASLVAIDNKIEQAMDLVKSHLMYAVREEVEVLKEQIKELIEKNSQLEQENNLLKALASPEQLAQFQAQVHPNSISPSGTTGSSNPPAQPQPLPSSQSSGTSA
ncbi:hypothetical protein UPYG_G00016800 [Umbra pygmaea]|uniref:TSC22 domain family protein 1 n=1 Tax=Umbra pygmaea TaxID=75934 RepID=A0ABD0XJT8_UMBPY